MSSASPQGRAGGDELSGTTGTTGNYGDAWFAGGNDDITVAIWVGYADKLQPMEFEHAGSPVAGGTYPAEIFHDFMTSWLEMRDQRRADRAALKDDETSTAPALPVEPTDVPSTDQRFRRRPLHGRRRGQDSARRPQQPESRRAPGRRPRPSRPPSPPPEAATEVEPARRG